MLSCRAGGLSHSIVAFENGYLFVTNTEPEKRKLKFADFDGMIAEARSLCENGYTSNGNWNLGQAAFHVSEWARFPLDGFPSPALPGAEPLVAPEVKRKIFSEGFEGGMATDPGTVAEPDAVSDSDGVDQLEKVANRILAFDGESFPSPFFGKLDREAMVTLVLRHAEHHLGYLEPN